MKNALILHGTDFAKAGQESTKNWFPWLKTELENRGYEVWLPELPEASRPNADIYWDFLKDFDFNEDTILIGHSSGATALFCLLNRLPISQKIAFAISVAGFYQDKGWNCEALVNENFDWEKIRHQAKKIVLLASDDDPYIVSEQSQHLAEHSGGELIWLTGQKHMSVGSYGEEYKKFPLLLDLISSRSQT